MSEMVADRLEALWKAVEQKKISADDYERQRTELLAGYADAWRNALLREGQADLRQSMMNELTEYLNLGSLAELEVWRQQASRSAESDWDSVITSDPGSVQGFYDRSQIELYNLLLWHTLSEDDSPLAYVAALRFAEPLALKTYLDFGAGVGSGGILMARHGYKVALADISSPLLRFSKWRHDIRRLPVECIDLKTEHLPANSFDLITAMDVFEHLVDPVEPAESICAALRPGGILLGRFHIDPHDKHRSHIARDFKAMFLRMRDLGLTEVWRDKWLWGHQAFQKARTS